MQRWCEQWKILLDIIATVVNPLLNTNPLGGNLPHRQIVMTQYPITLIQVREKVLIMLLIAELYVLWKLLKTSNHNLKILIIGSKGFIGFSVFTYLSKKHDYQVWGCDVVVDYTATNYFLIDASNSDFEEVFQQQPFSVCINCSGAANVPNSLLHPLRDYYLNTLNVFKILESIRKHAPACRFLNISSAAV